MLNYNHRKQALERLINRICLEFCDLETMFALQHAFIQLNQTHEEINSAPFLCCINSVKQSGA